VDEMITNIFSSDKNTAKFNLPKQNYTKATLNNQTIEINQLYKINHAEKTSTQEK